MKPWAESFYKGRAWQDCRNAYYLSKYGICERCGKPGLIVHHRTHLNALNINDPNITLAWDNLQLLCQDCHNKVHGQTEAVRNGLMFDEQGNLVEA